MTRSLKHFRKALLTVALTAGMMATVSGVTICAAQQPLAKVRVGDTVSFAHLGVYVGIQKDIFKKHGIEIERIVMPGGSKVLGTLISGDIDVGYLAAVSALQAQFQGRAIKIVGASHVMEIYSLLGRNDLKGQITKPADLKGHTVGITAPGSGSWAFANFLAQAGSLDPENDIKVVPIGAMTALISALKSNRVDTVTLWEPGTTMALSEGAGYSIIDLLNPEEHKNLIGSPESLVEVIAVQESFIKEKRETLRKFFDAQNEAYAWIHKAPVEEVAKAVAPLFGNPDMAVLQKAVQRMIPGVPTASPVDEKLFNETMNRMVKSGVFKEPKTFAQAVDNSVSGPR